MSDPARTEIDVDAVASFRRPLRLADWDDLLDRVPYGARAAGIELVIVRFGPAHSVFSGRCQHRGALLVDGRVVGDDLVCGLHGWDYRVDTGVSSYDDHQHLHRFDSVVHDDAIWIAEVRGLAEGTPAISPARFPQWQTLAEIGDFVAWARERSGGIPMGVKLSAQHIEADIDAAIELDVDYIILDGRGGGTGAAPRLFRDHISVPTMPALARARRHLDRCARGDITLIATGGLRTAPDIAKALALGADAVALANSALQAIGCVGMRACNTDKCPVGIATQDPVLRARLPVGEAAQRLARFLEATTELIGVLARACGHDDLAKFAADDLITFDREIAHLTGVTYAGVNP